MIRKVIIPAAGLGTRLLTATKEMPKEMLPVFAKGLNGQILAKPMLQLIFEQLYDVGFREFCFIVGRGKRAAEDHFNKDTSFIRYLHSKGKEDLSRELEVFYRKLDESVIVFINQPEPRGFGDAVYRAKSFVQGKPFLVHAGDDIVLSEKGSHITRLIRVFKGMNADIAFLVERVGNPRTYGVITGVKIDPYIYKVTDIVEKPRAPPSNIAVVAIYVFHNKIFKAIEQIRSYEAGETQLTDAIKHLILDGCKVYAVELLPGEKRIDIGTPESYWEALKYTFSMCSRCSI
ncbi:NTP transferase domain-containing protein [Candidatus Bathyarchaeota archaeon]|nr:NTP transferase domain-containing protein [Candidatus Bathyarchaeota archaeon]